MSASPATPLAHNRPALEEDSGEGRTKLVSCTTDLDCDSKLVYLPFQIYT